MNEKRIADNLIVKLSFEFALKVIVYVEMLEERRKFVIAKQLLKSGTSIGANVREAQNCESRADFIHKFKIAAKEADETQYWLQLCKESAGYPDCEALIDDLDPILRIITKIIHSSKNATRN